MWEEMELDEGSLKWICDENEQGNRKEKMTRKWTVDVYF